jgi:dTDP-4-amino-4,6-dideoxygalactose transaminase
MGEGGVVTTNDADLADRLRRFRNHGMVRDRDLFKVPGQALNADGEVNPWYYEMPEPGFNYRASDINCALGLSQLGKLARFVERRAELIATYDSCLRDLDPIVRPLGRVAHGVPAWHLCVVLVDFAGSRTERATVMRHLQQAGVGSQVHYLPVHRQPYYRDRYGLLDLPGADRYYERCLSLPLFVGMTEADVARVVDALGRTLSEDG